MLRLMNSESSTKIDDVWHGEWTAVKLENISRSQHLAQKKVAVALWSSVADIIHHNFLNLARTTTAEMYCQYIDEMLQKL